MKGGGGGRRRRNNGNRHLSSSSKQNPTVSGDSSQKTVGNSEPVPHDLILDILARLPAKSLVRFRSVSHLWSRIITGRYLVNSFLTRSVDRPRLLITFPNYFHLERQIFSSPHENPSVTATAAVHDVTVPGFTHYYVSESVRGLICLEIETRLKICNPSTKQVVTLPKILTETDVSPDYALFVTNFFGYDQVQDEYKVLNTMVFKSDDRRKKVIMEHRVFVLGKKSWRRIEEGPKHSCATSGICINGVVYYGAWTNTDNLVEGSTIVAFDVRLEKHKLVKMPVGNNGISFHDDLILINLEGKLAVLDYFKLKALDKFILWVLEDESRERWSKKSFAMPSAWRDFVGGMEFYLAGTIHTGEIILAPRSLSKPFYVFYYDMKRKNLRRVEIEGMPDHPFRFGNGLGNTFSNLTFTNHVESIMFLEDPAK